MRLETLSFENYRQYRSATFSFPVLPSKNDIHIILGNNGTGKTNMLNAITWCLYGKENHLGDQSTATSMLNSHYANSLRQNGEKQGMLKVVIDLSSETDTIKKLKVTRSAIYNINSNDETLIKENLDVMYMMSDGNWKGEEIEENAFSLIHRFVPEEINEYIFFDGEQLEKYFQKSQRENISNGIKELTQSSIIEKTIRSIKTYISGELDPKIRNCGDEEVQQCQRKVDSARQTFDCHDAAVREQTSQIEKFKETLAELETRIKGHEGIKEQRDRYFELEEEAKELDEKKRGKIAEMMRFTREYYLYFALYPAMKSLYEYIMQQEEAGNLPPKIDKELLSKILDAKRCLICHHDLDDEHLRIIEELKKTLELSTETSTELNKCITALKGYFSIIDKYPSKKGEYINAYKEIEKRIEDNQEEYTKLDAYLKSIPNHEQLVKDLQDRDELKETLSKAIEQLGASKYARKQAENALLEADKKLEEALKQNEKLAVIKSKKEYLKEAERVLDQTKTEILSECREEMQQATFEIFAQLLWKKDNFQRVEIEDDYTFKLLDNYNNQTLGSCSAAERALLALSFTLALQDTSKHDSLLYIDTPIGRVDLDNRENFIKVLLGISNSKQVILTFTPSEYDYNVQQLLNGKCSSFCKLIMTDQATKIEEVES